MKKKALFGVMLASILSIGLLSGCGQKDDTSVSKNKKYIIACDAKYAPFSIEENGSYKGIDVEVLEAIAKVEGFEYELKPMDFNGIIPGIVSNQIDGAVSAISITDERKKTLDFSDSYFESGISLVVNKNNTSINVVDDLNGKKVSTKKGTAGSRFAEENEKAYNLQLNYFDDSPSMFQAVENGNADFLIEDYPVISYKIKVDPNTPLKIVGEKLETSDYGFAVKKGANKELLDKFNDGLKKLKENGEYDKIIEEYIAK